MDLSLEIKLASQWVRQADALLQPWVQARNAAVSNKAGGQVVTEADCAVSELLVAGISRAFPADAICSEECGDHDVPGAARRWIIDPIDGTRSFIGGTEGFAIMLALAVQGTPVLGVVHDPVARTTWLAVQGGGVARNNERINPGTGAPLLAWSPYACAQGCAPVADGLGIDVGQRLESFGLRAASIVAQGAGACGSRPNSPHIWDSAAGHVIVSEAGGTITDYDGERLDYSGDTLHTRGLVATLGVNHARACELMRTHLP